MFVEVEGNDTSKDAEHFVLLGLNMNCALGVFFEVL